MKYRKIMGRCAASVCFTDAAPPTLLTPSHRKVQRTFEQSAAHLLRRSAADPPKTIDAVDSKGSRTKMKFCEIMRRCAATRFLRAAGWAQPDGWRPSANKTLTVALTSSTRRSHSKIG